MSGSDENHGVEQWRKDIEWRAAGGKRPVKRGGRGSRAAASGTWTAEGRTQCAGQLDIWQCIEVAEAERGQAEQQDEE